MSLRAAMLSARAVKYADRYGVSVPEIVASSPSLPKLEPEPVKQKMLAAPAPLFPSIIDEIKQLVATRYDVSIFNMLAQRRNYKIVHARQVAMYLCCEHTTKSTPAIGRSFDKDHTTVLYAHKKITDKRAQSQDFDAELAEIEKLLRAKLEPAP